MFRRGEEVEKRTRLIDDLSVLGPGDGASVSVSGPFQAQRSATAEPNNDGTMGENLVRLLVLYLGSQ